MGSRSTIRYGRLALAAFASIPWPLMAAGLADYTQRRFSLGGALGLRSETYQYETQSSHYDRHRLRKEVALNGSGFVWDPRFMSFSAGATYLQDEVSSSSGDSEFETIGYQVNTTWFGHKRHPLNLYATKSRNTVDDEFAPSYDLDTETFGARWGLDNQLLGNVQISYDTQDVQSDSEFVERDEHTEIYAFEGKRRTTTEADTLSDTTYGYRFNESEDEAIGSLQKQHYWYGYNRTSFGDKANLSTNLTYYDREDIWQEEDPATPSLNALESKYMALNSGLTVRTSPTFRHHYDMALSHNEVSQTSTDSYSLGAGVVKNVGEAWENFLRASLLGARTETEDPGSGVEQSSETRDALAESGFRYSATHDAFLVNGGYTMGVEFPLKQEEGVEKRSTLRQDANIGYSRQIDPAYSDAANYYISTQSGLIDSTEQNARYSFTGRPTERDTFQTSLEYRLYEENSDELDVISKNTRLNLTWAKRLGASNNMTLTGGRSDSSSNEARSWRTHIQARLSLAPRLQRNLRFSGMLQREDETTSEGYEQRKLTAELNLQYVFGKWQSMAQYKYREQTSESVTLDEQTLMLYIKRHFATRL